MKHTPGPWETKEDGYGYWGIYDRSGECIAETTEREDEANARLIAAAPELLRLLRIAHDDFRELGFCTVLPEIDELLTQIEGRKQRDNVQES